MRILWISGRDIGSDLASTTELSLLKEMRKNGMDTILMSPGDKHDHGISHISLSPIKISGVTTISGSLLIRRKLGIIKEKKIDLVMIDWRYVTFLKRQILRLGVPWCIIDRGPPARSGLFGGRIRRELLRNLQKILYKSAWKFADKHASCGFVVSKMHEKLVKGITKKIPIKVIPAGSYSNKNLAIPIGSDPCIKLAYVGRLDKKRGIMDIFELSNELEKLNVNHHISIAGEGDLSDKIKQESSNIDHVSFIGKISRDEIGEFLSGQHVGIMPMPDIPIWRIASPLKLSEYLSHGLAIVGPFHSGNTLSDTGSWEMLSTGTNWPKNCAEKLSCIKKDDWHSIRKSALSASESLQWDVIGEKLCRDLRSVHDSSLSHGLD